MFYLLLVFLIVSCSSDDDAAGEDRIVGSWTPVSYSYHTGSGGDHIELDDCEKEETISFEEDGHYTYLYKALEGEECVSIGSKAGIWENLGKKVYQIDLEGDYDLANISFSSYNKVMTIEYAGKDEEAERTYRKIFKRIK